MIGKKADEEIVSESRNGKLLKVHMYTNTVTEKRFLSRKLSKRTSKIIRDCPNIGITIESFVEDQNVRRCRCVAFALALLI